jgi:aspartate aminotransferase
MRIKKSNLHVNLNLRVRGLETSSTLAINEQCNRLKQEGREIFKLGLGQSPFPVPEIVVEALKRNAHQKDYLPVKGLADLRRAVADYNMRTQKVCCSPDDVLIGPGSKELIFILQLVYYGDLIIPTPSWVSYAPQAKIIGHDVHWAPAREDNYWRLSYADLEAICEKDPDRPRIVILNYPSNPTGYTYPIERLKLLAQVARKYKVVLVSDEIYGGIHHTGQHVSIARYYPEGTIISGGISKWCGAGGWRLGTLTFPSSLRWLQDAMAVVASETFTSTSAPIQHAAIEAFRDSEEISRYLYHSRKVLRCIARYLTDKLHKMDIPIQLPHGGFYLFPNFEPYREKLAAKNICSSTQLCHAILQDTGVAMLPGSDFGCKPEILTTRIAYVDFDGEKAIAESIKHAGENLPDITFVNNNCPNLVKAFERLGNWLADL